MILKFVVVEYFYIINNDAEAFVTLYLLLKRIDLLYITF
ncbi:hypothetical protein wVul_1520 [Wolbachia endosymbiont of Armadillidium vulgare str. wVulC]|nr:hypothetical protein wVul_1520 [Wolbachia endosymbiont of Armadillidium vulgare str. wVulC]